MKMLVTGATSGLGRNLVTHLLQKGFDVTATGRNVTAGALLAQEGAKFLPANIADTKAIDTLCANIDMVFHCAALSSPWGQYNDFYSANVLGTKNVVAGCLKHHVSRLIHVSTPSIYFDFTAKLNINENDPLPKQPANYYAATKLEAEHIVEEAFEKYGLPVISIRPRAMFGPYDATIVPRILRASKGGRVPLIGGGNALVDATYVGNVVESLLLCAKAPASCFGKKYNITNGEPLPFKLFLEKIFAALEIPFHPRVIPFGVAYSFASIMEVIASLPLFSFEPTLTRYGVATFGVSQTLDISAARLELNYQPKISLDEGALLFARWCKANHILLRN